MALFEGIQEVGTKIQGVGMAVVEGVVSAATKITTAFRSPEMRNITQFIERLGPALKPFVMRIPVPEPVLAIIKTIIVDIIPAIARLLLNTIPETEAPEELGRKIERAAEMDIEPEDFDSQEEYLNYVREKIPDEAPGFFEALDEKDRLKYAAVGSGMYVNSMEERYGVTLDPAFWNAVSQSEMSEFFSIDTLIRSLEENGISDGSLLDDFFAGRLNNENHERVEESLRTSLLQKMGDVGADVFRKQIDACVDNYRKKLAE